MFSWRMENVIDQVVDLLQHKWLPPTVPIGMDGRFPTMATRMLPSWVFDIIAYFSYARPAGARS